MDASKGNPSVQSSIWAMCHHIARCSRPGAVRRRAVSHRQRRFRPCLALLPAGVTWPSALLRTPVVSYATFSPSLPPPGLPQIQRIWGRCPRGGGGGCLFLWPFSGRLAPFGGSPPRLLSDAVLYGVRTFLDPDYSGPRLPDQPEVVA